MRGFGDGFAIIILPAYLAALGFSATQIGFVLSASLLGTALLTLGVGFIAPGHDLRNLLLAGAFLMIATGVVFPNVELLAVMAIVAFVGTINPSTGDLGVLVPLEHAMLAHEAPDQERTRTFARYSLIGALSMAAGSLAAALPDFMAFADIGRVSAFKIMFYAYACAWALVRRALPAVTPRAHERGPPECAARTFARGCVQTSRPIQSRCVCRRLCRSISVGAVAFRTFRHVAYGGKLILFLDKYTECVLLSGRCVALEAFRPRQHDGLYSHSVQHLLNRGRVLAQFDPDSRLTVSASRALANGCADTHLLRHGRSHASRAHRCRKCNRGPSQSRIVVKSGLGGRDVGNVVFRLTVGDLRGPQDRL